LDETTKSRRPNKTWHQLPPVHEKESSMARNFKKAYPAREISSFEFQD
jgi:hypothetical protein